ncbi:hypothetical protein ACQFX9_18245 [Aliinostoc sp. HNIBRCY26]|uniref:hypothetical protein n=1 Tax=Aliinostoc sp. HNIBRCY26 TaxID=3418997 RepID=UPI003D073B1A
MSVLIPLLFWTLKQGYAPKLSLGIACGLVAFIVIWKPLIASPLPNEKRSPYFV